MARQPKPWYRADRRVWCVTIDGTRHNLGRGKKAAFARFRELLSVRGARRTPVADASLVVVIDRFLDWVARNRSVATYEWYRGRLQSFAVAYPDLSIDHLKPYHVEQWAGENPRLSVTTRRNLMRSVKRCLKWAVAQGHLDRNPISGMEVPTAEPRDVFVTPEEFEALIGFAIDPGFVDLLRVTYETGCRPQESLRVEARHVDLRRQRWVFPARESKGKKMPRVVYLTDAAAEITQRLLVSNETGPLFRNGYGRSWTKDSVGCAFDRIQVRMGKDELDRRGDSIPDHEVSEFAKTLSPRRKTHGLLVEKTPSELQSEAVRKLTQRRARRLAPRYSLYALRHSWATRALQSGVDALTVAILMGHRDPSTLARTYQHLSHDPAHLLHKAQQASR